jgi:hypothetical protein
MGNTDLLIYTTISNISGMVWLNLSYLAERRQFPLQSEYYTDKKENQMFPIYNEIQSGEVAKSYIRKGFLQYMYEEMRKYFPIYEEAVSHM